MCAMLFVHVYAVHCVDAVYQKPGTRINCQSPAVPFGSTFFLPDMVPCTTWLMKPEARHR